MTPFETAGLLGDIVAFAQDVICRPQFDLQARRELCEALEARLESEIAASTGGSRFLDNGAPLLLTAIDRALYRRHLCDEDMAEKWDSIIGNLMPLTRADARAALESMSDVQERPTR